MHPPPLKPAPTRARILFVDDEPAILNGLENLFRKDRARWEIVFVLGGQAALDKVRQQPFDIVISDMQMPGIDGVALLNAIKHESPRTVRMMLSGDADEPAIVRAVPALDRVLTKPCDRATLREAIERGIDAMHGVRAAAVPG